MMVVKTLFSGSKFAVFHKGWQLSFRIHNASTLVEPSLKFDINIVGLPGSVARNVIVYG